MGTRNENTDLTDGNCCKKAVVCSNVSGGVSDTFPCACGVTTNATQSCVSGEVCTATNDTDGQCEGCDSFTTQATCLNNCTWTNLSSQSGNYCKARCLWQHLQGVAVQE